MESYQNYFFIYKVEDTVDEYDAYQLYRNPDEELYQRITANDKLLEQLNQVGESDMVMHMLFCKEGIWVKFIGPFFEEEVMAEFGYIYQGSEEAFTEELYISK